MKSILINLLTNAIKFTNFGSITLNVEFFKSHLTFNIIDTGIGMTNEKLTEINNLLSDPELAKNMNKTFSLGLLIS